MGWYSGPPKLNGAKSGCLSKIDHAGRLDRFPSQVSCRPRPCCSISRATKSASGRNFTPIPAVSGCDVAENDPRDRTITDVLYGGDEAHRIRQEIVLGIGGERLLRALGFSIDTYHPNEGHAAFLALSLLTIGAGNNDRSWPRRSLGRQCVGRVSRRRNPPV